jgi:hypothetical protein
MGHRRYILGQGADRRTTMSHIPKRVSERLSKETRKFQRVLKKAVARDINESDTVVIITDMLSRVFGFDKYAEITSEYAIRGTYCDLAVKVDDKVKFLIEVKAIGLTLKESHIRQAIGYGSQHGIQWVVLTNGVQWQIHRVKFDRPVGSELLASYDFLDLSPRRGEDMEMLFLLCKEGLSKDVIEEYHEHVMIVNRFIIGAILQSEDAIKLVRRELRRVSPDVSVDLEEVESIISSDVLKRDILEGDEAGKAKTIVKKASSRRLRKKVKKPAK